MAIEEGNTISVHYTGKLDDGQVFDTSEGRDPLQFEVGSGQLIAGFDEAVRGMDVGDKTTVAIPPTEGYGEHDPERILTLSREQVGGIEPEVGQVLGLQDEQGNQHQAKVVAVTDDDVKLDFNHFLAGQTLHFDIEVVAVA